MPHLTKNPKLFVLKRFCLSLADFATPTYHSYARWSFKNRLLRLSGMQIGKNVVIDDGLSVLKGCEENVEILDYSVVNTRCKLMAYNKISIGKFCMLASDVSITNGGHNRNTYEPFSSEVKIGNGVWLGHRATIVAKENGISIADNAIVAAGALVISDVPRGAIVAGVPAKIIGYRNIPDSVSHIGDIRYCPHTFNILQPACVIVSPQVVSQHIMPPADILANSVLTGAPRSGSGGIDILGARVVDENGADTLSVQMTKELRFYIYAKATKKIKKPYFAIVIYDKNNNLIFTGTTIQIGDYCHPLDCGDEIVVGFRVKMSIESGQYTFRLSCAEPLEDYHPNKGNTLDAHESLGPISVLFDYEKERAPFYGAAQLPMEML